MKTISFIGDEKSELYGNDSIRYDNLKETLKIIITELIDEYNYNKFITQTEYIGFEYCAFNSLKELKSKYEISIDLVHVSNKENKDEEFVDNTIVLNEIDEYKNIIKPKNGETIDEYFDNLYNVYKIRDRYIVDKCDLLIAGWNGSCDNFTYECIKYAKENNKDILWINPFDYSVKLYSNGEWKTYNRLIKYINNKSLKIVSRRGEK